MKTAINTVGRKLYFSGWSGKKYAVFAAMGRQVCISNLSVHICERALLKSAKKGVIVSDAQSCDDFAAVSDTDEILIGYYPYVAQAGDVYLYVYMNNVKTA